MIDQITEANPETEYLTADGFNEAILGVEQETNRIIYSVAKCLEILRRRDGMTELEAREYFSCNLEGSSVGPQTPIWCYDDFT